jgi:hypothetical protein
MADLLSLHKEPNILPLDSFLVLSRNSPACNWSKMLCPWKRTHITQDEMRSYSSAQLIESIDQMEVLRELQKMDLSLSLSLSLYLWVCVCVCVCAPGVLDQRPGSSHWTRSGHSSQKVQMAEKRVVVKQGRNWFQRGQPWEGQWSSNLSSSFKVLTQLRDYKQEEEEQGAGSMCCQTVLVTLWSGWSLSQVWGVFQFLSWDGLQGLLFRECEISWGRGRASLRNKMKLLGQWLGSPSTKQLMLCPVAGRDWL